MDAQHNDRKFSLCRGESPSIASFGSPDRQQGCGFEGAPELVGHDGRREKNQYMYVSGFSSFAIITIESTSHFNYKNNGKSRQHDWLELRTEPDNHMTHTAVSKFLEITLVGHIHLPPV